MFCPKCGKPVSEDDTFCPYCGNKIEARPATAEVSFGRRFEEDSRGEVKESGAVTGSPASLKKIIVFVILSFIGMMASIMAMIASSTLFIEGEYLNADMTALNVVLLMIGLTVGLILSIVSFGAANKMGREKQPYKPLQILTVIFSSIGIALCVVAGVFQGVTIIVG